MWTTPAFGTAIISRLLEAEGYKVGVLAQPRYSDCEDFKRFGKPKYGFLHRRRQRGQHGESITRRQDPPRRGRVLARRQGRRTARPQRHRLHQTCKAGLPRSARHSGRPRGLAPPLCPLRLLAGHRPAQHRRGLWRGHHQLRHGRAPDRGDCPPSGGRRAGGEHHRCGWHLLPDRLRPPARAVCGVRGLQEGRLR